MYLAECPAALSRAYAYTYVPSRLPSRSFTRLCIHIRTWPSAQPLSRTPICSLGRQFALSDANSLFWLPIRSFTRDVTRPQRRPMPWLGSG